MTRFLDDYLLYLMARASAVASDQFHAQLSARGVPVATWRILAVLSDGPARVGALARAVMLNQPTLSKALDRLARDGLVTRLRPKGDRRVVEVALTDAGRALAQDLIPEAQAHQEALLARYSPAQRDALFAVLQDFLRMAEDADSAP